MSTRILFEGTSAVGVEFVQNKQTQQVRALQGDLFPAAP